MTRSRPGSRRHVLVTDASRGSAVAFIRSLGRRGWRVTAADSDPRSPGFRSRWTTDRLVYPDPVERTEAAVEALARAVRRSAVDLLVPITDEIGLPLAASRDRFDGLTRLALPEPEALEIARDKRRTLDVAVRLGVPVPSTCLVESVEGAVQAARRLGWPVVVKPQVSRQPRPDGTIDAFSVAYAGDEARLRALVADLEGRTGILLQRWRPGEGHGVELLVHEGRPLAAFQHRRLREVPVTGGASALRESVALDPTLFDYASRLLGDLAWSGLAMVEFRLTPTGPELMEINGRVWGSLPLAVRAGMDFPARLADLMLEGPPSPSTPVASEYAIGVRVRNLRLELSWMGNVVTGRRRYPDLPFPSRWAALRAAGSLLDPRIGDDLLVREDPAPGLAQVGTIVRSIGGRGRHGR